MTRVPAAKIEAVVVDALRRQIGHDATIDSAELLTTYVRQSEVRRTEVAISLLNEDQASEEVRGARRLTDTILPQSSSPAEAPPIRSDTRARLVTAIAGPAPRQPTASPAAGYFSARRGPAPRFQPIRSGARAHCIMLCDD